MKKTLAKTYYRYVGQTSTYLTERHASFSSSRSYGFVKQFFDYLKQITGREEWLENYRYFYVNPFCLSSPGYNLLDQGAVDQQKQMLISFFGIQNLLNIETGGLHASYDPGPDAFILYSQLPTRQEFFRKYRELTQPITPNVRHRAEEWILLLKAEYCKFQNCKSPFHSHAMFDRQLESICSQAVPKVVDINRHVLITCISSKVSPNSCHDITPFFSPELNDFGKVTCDHLSRLEAYQEGSNSFTVKSYADYFPFLDITPWATPAKALDALQEGSTQANVYMRKSSPLITVVLSKAATKFATSNFMHPHGFVQDRRFIRDFVGVPKRIFIHDIHLLEDEDIKEMPQDCSTIVISHLHPSLDKHTARDHTGVRAILDLTWQITLCIGQITIDMSTACAPSIAREVLINQIAEKCLPDSPELDPTLSILLDQLSQAKDQYMEAELHRNQENHRVVGKRQTQRIQRLEEGRMKRLGKAKGQANSDVRKKQANYLWKKNIPDLHLHLDRHHKQEWFQWIHRIKKDKYIFASLLQELSGKYSNSGLA